jgi:Fe-S cluster biogenesis protein NfuA
MKIAPPLLLVFLYSLPSVSAAFFATRAPLPVAARLARPAVLRMDALQTGGAEFTVENVDKVLDEIRPYLISDGGNVEVVSVAPEEMKIELRLQGACGTCPSATTTMRMGIERVLKEKWPSLGEVIEVGGALPDSQPILSIETAIKALESIMDAIAGLGGSVRVVSAADGTVELEYTGPEKIKLGIELALKESPLIENVVFI